MRVRVKGFRETLRRLTNGLAEWLADGRVSLPGGVVLELPDDLDMDCLPLGSDQRIAFVGPAKPRVTKFLAGLRFTGPITEIRFRQDASQAAIAIAGLPDVTVEFLDDASQAEFRGVVSQLAQPSEWNAEEDPTTIHDDTKPLTAHTEKPED
jgi:hypothetical protein